MQQCHYHPCQKEFSPKTTNGRFCSKACKNNFSVTKRRIKLKLMAIKHLGGCCSECGYSKSTDALEFHHTDPTQKEFGISNGDTRSWSLVETELAKCVLLCANCHREVHEKTKLTAYIVAEVIQDLA